jgi:hypothetical protein
MAKQFSSEFDDRLTALEGDFGALKDRLTIITQMISGIQTSRIAPSFQEATLTNRSILQGYLPSIPLLLFPSSKLPFSFPTQIIKGPCATATATIAVPGQGNYTLTINVAGESDCSVVANDPDGIVAFGPVAPGSSMSIPFVFFTPTLIAKCQGRGNCIAELTLTQRS